MTADRRRLGAIWLAAWLVIAAFSCEPTAAADGGGGGDAFTLSSTVRPAAAAAATTTTTTTTTTDRRTSRLQKPSSQVLNAGFDEIVVESNLQVHRGASKSKSKITLPNASANNSSAAASSPQTGGNKSARSLEV